MQTKKMQTLEKGFTLIEMLLVLVIISMVIYMSVGYIEENSLQTRVDRTSLQMQQILNAGLAYYVANGAWPANSAENNLSVNTLQQAGFLPPASINITSPWGTNYVATGTSGTTPSPLFYAYVKVKAGVSTTSVATMIAGKLPLAYTTASASVNSEPPVAGNPCATDATVCYVVASVNVPGQNLNNASAVNFAGIYPHGGCVPVPTCPVDPKGFQMTPEIIVTPTSVSGVNDMTPPGSQPNLYPITSFTAYAVGNTPLDDTPPPCEAGVAANSCTLAANLQTSGTAAAYWRVCLQVVTTKGVVTSTGSAEKWGTFVRMMAITRCSIQNEPSGTNFNLYTN